MHALVVYETLWGNTERLAREIGAGLSEVFHRTGDAVGVAAVGSVPIPLPSTVDLLVVGAPTHAFTLPTSATREVARQQGATRMSSSGLREWIAGLPSSARHTAVATFDTRVTAPRLPGSAAKKAMKQLIALGFRPLASPETFGVHGYEGPLSDGELERARHWAVELAGRMPSGDMSHLS